MAAVDDVSREIVQLVRGLRELHAAVIATAPETALDASAAAVLARLEELGAARLSTLASTLLLDVSTVSRQVPALERQGWVARERDPDDHRAQLLEITPAGRQVLDRVRRSRADVLRRLLPDWSDAELASFAGQLHRFNTDVVTHRPALVPVTSGSEAR